MFYIFGFYKFKKFKSLKKNKIILQKKIIKNKVRGTIILSKEGINGTISGKIKNVNKYIDVEEMLRREKIDIISNTKLFLT